MSKSVFAAAVRAFSAMAGASNAATELVTNGGFETGLSPWVRTLSASDSECGATSLAMNSGTRSLAACDNDGVGSAVQSLATMAGETCDVDFWVSTDFLSADSVYSYSLGGGAATRLSFAAKYMVQYSNQLCRFGDQF